MIILLSVAGQFWLLPLFTRSFGELDSFSTMEKIVGNNETV
jgi:hypothetical protein